MSRLNPIDPALLERLGSIVVRWGIVEAYVSEVLSLLLMADRGCMYVLTVATPVSAQLKWIETLVKFRLVDDQARAQMLETIADLNELRSERNALVHGLWNTGPEPATALVQSVRIEGTEMMKGEMVSLAELKELDEDLTAAIERIRAVMHVLETAVLVPRRDPPG